VGYVFGLGEISEVAEMIRYYSLDVRSATVSVDALVCASNNGGEIIECLIGLVRRYGGLLRRGAETVATRLGVPITTLRLALSPLAEVFTPLVEKIGVRDTSQYMLEAAIELDRAAAEAKIDYIGGFSAFTDTGLSKPSRALLHALPRILTETRRIMGFINTGSTTLGLSVDAVAEGVKALLKATREAQSPAPGAKLLLTVNITPDIPFLPGAHHGRGLTPGTINIAISGPKVAANALKNLSPKAPIEALHEELKKIGFKTARLGQLVLEKLAAETSLKPGSVDLSLAPTPEPGDSIAAILEEIGTQPGAPGSIAALALLVDALKKGGVMGVCCVGGYSGAMIPLTEDSGLAEAAAKGLLNIYKLIAMTSICSTGLDMVPVPGEETWQRIAGVTLDTLTIGITNNKTLGVRLLPSPGKKPGDTINLGGLLGKAPVMDLGPGTPENFIERGGRIPPPVRRLTYS